MNVSLSLWQLVGILSTVVGFVAGMVTNARKVVKPLLAMAEEWREFRGDWRGVPDRPGFPGHAGMGQRMQVVEGEVRDIRDELKFNGGGSLRDAVRRIEAQQLVSAQHAGAPVVTLSTATLEHTGAGPMPAAANHQGNGLAG